MATPTDAAPTLDWAGHRADPSSVTARSTWLCPTAFDRERLLDMEGKLAGPRALMYGSLTVAFLVGIPWVGAWIMIPLAGSIGGYLVLRGRVATSETPEFVLAATVVNAQVLIGVGIALSGGPHSPAIPILLLPIVTLPARFSTRGVSAGVMLTAIVMICSTVVADPEAFVDDPTYVLVGLAAIAGLAAFSHTLMRSEMEQRADAVLDPLTGLLNRKALATRFAEIAQQATQTGASVCLIACDLDRFKSVNDEHGHERGDAVLKSAAYTMRKSLRSFELAYRLGGDEFVVLLPGATLNQGAAVAERIRSALEADRPAGLALTASLGVAASRGAAVDFEPLFRAADLALYGAKRAGRNRVVTEVSPDEKASAVSS
jgi:diguanylate cyclase (GGDEF)-like protein